MDLTVCYGAESQTNKLLNPHTILIKLGLYIKHCQRHNIEGHVRLDGQIVQVVWVVQFQEGARQ